MVPIGEFRIGEDITVALRAESGDVSDVATITAAIVKVQQGSLGGPERVPGATPLAMTVSARAASGGIPAGWNLTLPAASSAGMSAGRYAIDAKLVFTSGAIDKTETSAIVTVTEAAV